MTNVKNKGLLILSIGLAFLITACNKGGKTGLLVPDDAAMVLHVDLASLSSKLTWAEIKQTTWFTEALNQTTDSLGKQLLNDPETSGLDPKGNLVMFLKRTGSNGYLAFEGSLKDAAKFSKVIEDGGKGKIKIEKDGEYSFVRSPDNDNAVVYFNDKLFVAIIDASGMSKGFPGNRSSFGGSAEKYPLDSLKLLAKNTFQLKGSKLLDSDKRFADLISDKADMHAWVNSGNLYSGLAGGIMAMMKFNALLDGAITAGKANFDNGKITADFKSYYGKEMTDLLKKNSGSSITDETISHLPEQDVLAAFSMSYAPSYIKDLIKLLGFDGIANAGLAQLGITIDDFTKANGGTQSFALTDVTITGKPTSITLDNGETIPYEKDDTRFDFVFGSSVGDKSSFQKLIDAFKKTIDKEMPVKDSALERIKSKLTDKWFAIGGSDAEVDAFLAGGKKPAYARSFAGHSMGGFVNLQKIFTTTMANSKKDTAYKKNLEVSANFWRTITMHSDIKGGEAISKVEINLADTQTNALKQLNQYIDKMYQAIPKKEVIDVGETAPIVDTAVLAAPPASVN
ncbi:DUF4836 family protein [Niabella drilacis]|uniref:DUF4836 family protein n=1 Tax=Niabella drilacis (strain DSM 25811 / CCM 8410 / CCUG 62505 / LMG 26954 / E90) TaxID=1285928 RepID=A0A1G6MZY6_NIADE|nr:DUF4836 family protein [Niabella drilacis]SDC61130.1 protein of unknown function [Niabella drilacis]